MVGVNKKLGSKMTQAKKEYFKEYSNIFENVKDNCQDASAKSTSIMSEYAKYCTSHAKQAAEVGASAIQDNARCALEGVRDICTAGSPSDVSKKSMEHIEHSMQRTQDAFSKMNNIGSEFYKDTFNICKQFADVANVFTKTDKK